MILHSPILLVVADGAGCSITDVDGNSSLDLTLIAGQDFYCEEHFRLAKELTGIVPQKSKVFFSISGAEVEENALKIAYKNMVPLPGTSCFDAFMEELLER
jgi:4-aminobutyrate aminotransferase-like enzyme